MTRTLSLQVELVLSLVKRDLKARYKESVLGFFWSLLKPAFLTVVLWAVFSQILGLKLHTAAVPYWLHVLLSVLTWNFFFGSVTDATHSVVANGNLLKKVPLNAAVFPMAAVLANGVHFALALGVALAVAAAAGPGFSTALIALPAVLALTALLALALGMILAALNVFYRDVGSALELIGLAWFYVSPVIYPITQARDSLTKGGWGEGAFSLYMMNPAAALLAAVRRAVLYGRGDGEIADRELLISLGWATLVTALLLTAAWVTFRRVGADFADEL